MWLESRNLHRRIQVQRRSPRERHRSPGKSLSTPAQEKKSVLVTCECVMGNYFNIISHFIYINTMAFRYFIKCSYLFIDMWLYRLLV